MNEMNEITTLINLTPHEINIHCGSEVISVPPSGTILAQQLQTARLSCILHSDRRALVCALLPAFDAGRAQPQTARHSAASAYILARRRYKRDRFPFRKYQNVPECKSSICRSFGVIRIGTVPSGRGVRPFCSA